MRELKFRALRKHKDGTTDMDYSERWVSLSEFFNHLEVNYPDASIMQYTGLFDDNGKRIYEGDFLSAVKFGTNIPVGQLWEVYYDEEKLTYYWRNEEGIKKPFWGSRLGSIQHIVVGNVHAMPDWDL